MAKSSFENLVLVRVVAVKGRRPVRLVDFVGGEEGVARGDRDFEAANDGGGVPFALIS